jgi:hypothetical protein
MACLLGWFAVPRTSLDAATLRVPAQFATMTVSPFAAA